MVFVNLAGATGISVPNGFAELDGEHLPTGIQFVAPGFSDARLLNVAHSFEQLTGWNYAPPAWVQAALTGAA
jgi:aspartyl-tRNA(Asn)/glutamyl-tRNA(Gln) amidotransferase subunit A